MTKKPPSFIKNNLDLQFPLHSRAHLLNKQAQENAAVFIKRDDELSFGISGAKYRKYASLLPYLIKHGYKSVALVGSAYSNHLLGLSQLLIENEIRPYIFVKRPNDPTLKGNFLFLNLLIPKEDLFYLEKDEWKEKDQIVERVAASKDHCCYIPEGGDMFAASPGSMTLGMDIAENSKVLGKDFSHVFIDSGTGFTAIHLILSLPFFSLNAHVHVIQAAEEPSFHEKLKHYKKHLESALQVSLQESLFTLYSPLCAKSFGATSPSLFTFIKNFAREEGIFLDPIYNAKMFLKANEIIKDKKLQGNILFIHSGGAFSLTGFEKDLAKTL